MLSLKFLSSPPPSSVKLVALPPPFGAALPPPLVWLFNLLLCGFSSLLSVFPFKSPSSAFSNVGPEIFYFSIWIPFVLQPVYLPHLSFLSSLHSSVNLCLSPHQISNPEVLYPSDLLWFATGLLQLFNSNNSFSDLTLGSALVSSVNLWSFFTTT